MLQVSNAESVILAAYEKIEEALRKLILQLGAPAEAKNIVDKYTVKMKSAMKEEINWVKMEPALIDAYVRVYDKKTISYVTKYYQSRAGQEVLKNQNSMVEATVGIMHNMTQKYILKLQSLQSEMTNDIKNIK